MLDGIDRDTPDIILWIEDADFPSIRPIERYHEAPKSEKKYYADIHGAPVKDLKGIIEYIHDNMKKRKGEKTKNIELWYIWLGNDEEDIIYKTCSLKELTEDYLRDIFLDDDNDYKLIITR